METGDWCTVQYARQLKEGQCANLCAKLWRGYNNCYRYMLFTVKKNSTYVAWCLYLQVELLSDVLFLEVLKFLTASVNAIGGLAFSVTVTLLVFLVQCLATLAV